MPVKILLACSGSVATVKLEKLLSKLQLLPGNVLVKVVLTKSSLHFTNRPPDSESVQYYVDENEWQDWNKIGDEILHIELGKWADVLVIAPLSANSLAKISNGICDNLLTSTVRAWDRNKPLLFAPAMNTRMLEHPITRPQLDVLVSWGYIEIPTIEKMLACGDLGYGAMAEVDTIVQKVLEAVNSIDK